MHKWHHLEKFFLLFSFFFSSSFFLFFLFFLFFFLRIIKLFVSEIFRLSLLTSPEAINNVKKIFCYLEQQQTAIRTAFELNELWAAIFVSIRANFSFLPSFLSWKWFFFFSFFSFFCVGCKNENFFQFRVKHFLRMTQMNVGYIVTEFPTPNPAQFLHPSANPPAHSSTLFTVVPKIR